MLHWFRKPHPKSPPQMLLAEGILLLRRCLNTKKDFSPVAQEIIQKAVADGADVNQLIGVPVDTLNGPWIQYHPTQMSSKKSLGLLPLNLVVETGCSEMAQLLMDHGARLTKNTSQIKPEHTTWGVWAHSTVSAYQLRLNNWERNFSAMGDVLFDGVDLVDELRQFGGRVEDDMLQAFTFLPPEKLTPFLLVLARHGTDLDRWDMAKAGTLVSAHQVHHHLAETVLRVQQIVASEKQHVLLTKELNSISEDQTRKGLKRKM